MLTSLVSAREARALGSLGDQVRPIIVRGADVPSWSGRDIGDVRVYLYKNGAFEPISFQLDEMIVRRLPSFPLLVPDVDELTFDFDHEEDGTIDADDELVIDPSDLGDEQAPLSSWVGTDTLRYELHVVDPRTGDTGHAYAFMAPGGEVSPVDHVRGTLDPAGSFTTDRYAVRYEDRWLLTSLSVDPANGGDGSNLIDRVKGREGAISGMETEDLWNRGATFLGAIDGPVRAAREVMGAASGLHTTHVDVFYRRHAERTINLRVHYTENIWFYFDMAAAATPGTYSDAYNSSLPIDGSPDSAAVGDPLWTFADTPHGSLFVCWEQLTPFPSIGPDSYVSTYYRDDASFDDGSGDDPGAHGNFGVYLRNAGDTNSSAYVTRQTWIPLPPGGGVTPMEWHGRSMSAAQVSVLAQTRQPPSDRDGDGVDDSIDGCPDVPDAAQEDADRDGRGDACDPCPLDAPDDPDGDGTCTSADDCPSVANPSQADGDSDGAGDACDPCPLDAPDDPDGDGACTAADDCPDVANPSQADGDGDGRGDACDSCPLDATDDADGDGACTSSDNCPVLANPSQADADGDGRGDACDSCPLDASDDADGDGTCASADNCPGIANPSQDDGDADGEGDACDSCPIDVPDDADGDGTCTSDDNCPSIANPSQADGDGDGRGDACDPCPLDAPDDADGDGACTSSDNCPGAANASQADGDGDGRGDACDPCPLDALDDADGDGACTSFDNCPGIANASQADGDGDGAGDACDSCPLDAPDDADGDGACASADNCPAVSNPSQADADADGAGDACDSCPLDAPDDPDGDGACTSQDNCPDVANADQADDDGDGAGDACDEPPERPEVLLMVHREGGDVVLTWSTGVAPYLVERSEAPTGFTTLAGSVPATAWRDPVARDGHAWYYAVQ